MYLEAGYKGVHLYICEYSSSKRRGILWLLLKRGTTLMPTYYAYYLRVEMILDLCI
jgi:hypothetical protein